MEEAALAGNVADGYRWTRSGFEARPYEYIGQIAPAGAASSTARDMAVYMLALLGDGQFGGVSIYGPRTAQAFRTPMRSTPKGINGWAHGFQVYDLPGGYRGFGHGGATLSFMSNMVTAPALNLGIFISTNSETGGPLVQRLPEAVVRQFYARPTVFPRAGSLALVRQADAYTGFYVTSQRAYRGLEGFVSQLVGGVKVAVTPDGRLVTAARDEVRTWAPDGDVRRGGFLSTTGDERLAFRMTAGQASSFQTAAGGALFERAPFWRQPRTMVLMAALTALAAFATLGGLALRNRREFRQNAIQSRASLIQNIQAALWLTALLLFGLWASHTSDIAQVMYRLSLIHI